VPQAILLILATQGILLTDTAPCLSTLRDVASKFGPFFGHSIYICMLGAMYFYIGVTRGSRVEDTFLEREACSHRR
jgi:hypothetical protein